MNPVDQLSAELFRRGILVTPEVLQDALAATGQTLGFGARAAVEAHLSDVRTMSVAVWSGGAGEGGA